MGEVIMRAVLSDEVMFRFSLNMRASPTTAAATVQVGSSVRCTEAEAVAGVHLPGKQ